MKQTLFDLFTSKKFLAVITAIVVAGAGRLGLNVDPVVLDRIWQALLVYVGAQGLADIGKSAALVKTANENAPSSPAAAAVSTMAKIGPAAAMLALLLVVASALVFSPACSSATAKQLANDAKVSLVDCTKADAAAIEQLIVQLAWDGIEQATKLGTPDWGALATAAEAQGVVVGGCAFSTFVHLHPWPAPSSSGVAVSALMTPPAAPDPARAALERLRAGFGGVHWHTSTGVL